MKAKQPGHRILLIVLIVILLISVALVVLAFKPFRLKENYLSDPADSYAEAVERIDAILAEEDALVNLSEVCGTRFMTHEEKTENVIVFLHGFTSCPDQFKELGEAYFANGYNVYIPRQPRHGFSDHTGKPLKGLTAEELAQFGTETADIAQGLGERVIIAGLSGGGSVATWLTQERSDIDLAVPIAPFLGVGFIPRPFTRPVTNLILLIPDIFQWWDPVHKINNPLSAPYSYRGYWMHALFENLRLGFATEADAERVKPAAGAILVVTNANDSSVNNAVVAEFEQMWIEHGEEFLQTYQFPKDQHLPHDLITYNRSGGNPDLVYAKLMELIR
jgi:carboxylesterase